MIKLMCAIAMAALFGQAAWALPGEGADTELPRSTTLEALLRNSSYTPSELAKQKIATYTGRYEIPVTVPRFAGADGVSLHGEIVVMEGDDEIVTDYGQGRYGLAFDWERQDPATISRRYIDSYGDNVDFIAIWTSFWDYGADGLAYYIGIRNEVTGLGADLQDDGNFWGSRGGGRLQGLLNMKSIDVYGNIENPNNMIYPVMGQELTHRWLAFMHFQRPNGTTSDAMLGRDAAHWSVLLHSDASVQDGSAWRDNDNGTFTLVENNARFSPLDLYGMGIIGPDEVAPWFLIEDATFNTGRSVNPASQLNNGTTVRGSRTDITIDQVIAAHGPRNPSHVESQKDFRIAYVLVTRPGETAEQVGSELASIQTFAATFEQRFTEWTDGRAFLCSRVTADCDRPSLSITDTRVDEVEGDGDGMPEPGETIAVRPTIQNTGGGPAQEPRVHLVVPDGLDISVAETPLHFDDLAAGGTVTLDPGFVLTIGEDAPCGEQLTLNVEIASGDVLTTGSVTFPIGIRELFSDSFEGDNGWLVNADGADSAAVGQWERAQPQGVNGGNIGLNFQTQPSSGQSGEGALVTGAASGDELGSYDIDEGATSVVSPTIDLSAAVDPSLSYYTWRTGLEISRRRVEADDNDPLTTEISGDGGATWILVEEDRSNEQRWIYKEWRLLDFFDVLPATLRIRFTARDDEPQSLSEAAVDSVVVFDMEPTCFGLEPETPVEPTDPTTPGEGGPGINPNGEPGQNIAGDSSGGCAGAGEGGLGWALIVLLGIVLVVARRRMERA